MFARWGVNDFELQQLGRWRSDTYKLYIDPNKDWLFSFSARPHWAVPNAQPPEPPPLRFASVLAWARPKSWSHKRALASVSNPAYSPNLSRPSKHRLLFWGCRSKRKSFVWAVNPRAATLLPHPNATALASPQRHNSHLTPTPQLSPPQRHSSHPTPMPQLSPHLNATTLTSPNATALTSPNDRHSSHPTPTPQLSPHSNATALTSAQRHSSHLTPTPQLSPLAQRSRSWISIAELRCLGRRNLYHCSRANSSQFSYSYRKERRRQALSSVARWTK